MSLEDSLELHSPNSCTLIKNQLNNLPATFIRNNNIERLETVQLEGDPTIGTVYHYAQIHNNSDVKDPETKLIISKAQRAILEDLVKNKIKHVFVEGVGMEEKDLYNDGFSKIIPFIFSDPINFQNRREEILGGTYPSYSQQDLQNFFLRDTSAAIIYYYLHKDEGIHLHLAENRKECNEYKGEDFRVNGRENMTSGILNRFLDENPGETIALIFGAEHDFSDNIPAIFNDKVPMLKRIQSPALNNQIIERGLKLYCEDYIETAKNLSW